MPFTSKNFLCGPYPDACIISVSQINHPGSVDRIWRRAGSLSVILNASKNTIQDKYDPSRKFLLGRQRNIMLFQDT